jgi:hypothetical protein
MTPVSDWETPVLISDPIIFSDRLSKLSLRLMTPVSDWETPVLISDYLFQSAGAPRRAEHLSRAAPQATSTK